MNMMLKLVVSFLVCFGAALSSPISNVITTYQHIPIQNIPFEAMVEATASPTCSNQDFKQCLSDFATALNYPSGELPTNAIQFVHFVNQMQSTEKGYKDFCKARKDLVKCVGGDDAFDTCMTLKNLCDVLGTTFSFSYVYLQIFGVSDYQCGVYQKFFNNKDCINKVNQDNITAIMQCGLDYGKNLQDHPTESCKYTQVYVDCYSAIWDDVCDKTVTNLMCNTQKSGYKYIYPTCALTCSKYTNPDGESNDESE